MKSKKISSVKNKSEKTVQEDKPQKESLKFAVYLPENLDFDKLIKNNPPKEHPAFLNKKGQKLKNAHFKKDKLAYLLHLISYLPTIKKDFDYDANEGFIPINKQKLQNEIGIHDYRQHLDYLKGCGIILEGTHYVVGEKSRGIKFTPEYEFSDTHRKYITDKSLVENIISSFSEDCYFSQEEFDYLYKWWETGLLRIDYDAAKLFIKQRKIKESKKFRRKYGMNQTDFSKLQLRKEKRSRIKKVKYPNKQYNAAVIIIDRLRHQEFVNKIDTTAGRLHTLLTQLPKDLRQFVTYNGERLVSVDLVNSQPFLTTALLDKDIFTNNPILKDIIIKYNPYHSHTPPTMLEDLIGSVEKKSDIIKYKKIVAEGKYYEEFGKMLHNKGLIEEKDSDTIRKQAKEATFSSFFASNFDFWNIPAMQNFKEAFPNVYKVFSQIKYQEKGTKKVDKVHKALPVSLQALEAELFIKKICKRISEIDPNMPIFTIHDSVVTTVGDEAIVQQVIEEEMHKVIGVTPQVKTEYWTKDGTKPELTPENPTTNFLTITE